MQQLTASLLVQEKPARHNHLVSSVRKSEISRRVGSRLRKRQAGKEMEEKVVMRGGAGGGRGYNTKRWIWACPAPAKKQNQPLHCQ